MNPASSAPVNTGQQPGETNLSDYHGKPICVEVSCGCDVVQFRGEGVFLEDPELGRALMVRSDTPESNGVEVVIVERQWAGTITAGSDGWFCFRPTV